MIPLRSSRFTHLAAFGGFAFGGLLMLAASTRPALADPLAVTVLAPGVQTPAGTSNYETFNTATPTAGTLTTNFNGSSVTGTYTGSFAILAADAYGGAGGSRFISTSGLGGSYTLSLSAPVNYFGLWLSALDAGNDLSFYNNNTLVETFTPADFINMVGACPSSANAYCGNPSNGLDPTEQFAYLNFYDATGGFNKIVFNQSNATGAQFESDNQAVASLDAPPGTSVVPEPASLLLLGSGLLGFAGIFRRQLLL